MKLCFVLFAVSSIHFCQGLKNIDRFGKHAQEFASLFYNKVVKRNNENFVFSPFSLYQTAGMLVVGARNNTEFELLRAMKLLPDDGHSYSRDQIANLMGKTYNNAVNRPTGIVFDVANGVFIQEGYTDRVRTSYTDVLSLRFRSEIITLDFSLEEDARAMINDWVSGRTRGQISDLIEEGFIKSTTRLLLANTVYFEGKWKNEFELISGKMMDFNVPGRGAIPVNYIRSQGTFRSYRYRTTNMNYIAVPYKSDIRDNGTYMVFGWPDKNDWSKFNNNPSLQDLDVSQWDSDNIILEVPKFEIHSTIDVKTILNKLRVNEVFSTIADLSGINDDKLYVSDFIHQARVEVTEEGTVAAAASAVNVQFRSTLLARKVTLDRPFMFGIYSEQARMFTFVGRLNNPEE